MLSKLKLRLIIAGVLILFNIATCAYVGLKVHDWTNSQWEQKLLKNVETKLDIKAKQDEIYTAPVDSDVTIRRLLNGTF